MLRLAIRQDSLRLSTARSDQVISTTREVLTLPPHKQALQHLCAAHSAWDRSIPQGLRQRLTHVLLLCLCKVALLATLLLPSRAFPDDLPPQTQPPQTQVSEPQAEEEETPESQAPARVDFLSQIYPIFKQHCLRCHGEERSEGSLRLDLMAEAAKGGHTGNPILGGGDRNSILQRVTTDDESLRMPKGEPPLPAEELDLIRRWVRLGTPWTDPPTQEMPPAQTPGYEITWESLQPLDPREWSPSRRRRVQWWVLRCCPVLLVMLLFIMLCDRCSQWVKKNHPRVQAPRGRLWRMLAAIPRSWQVILLLLYTLVVTILFTQEQGRLADSQVIALDKQVDSLARQAMPHRGIAGADYTPPRPMHPPRLGGAYYRGNDERNPKLFNNGFYRTCTLDVRLVRGDGTVLQWGDTVDPVDCSLRVTITQAPGSSAALFSPDIFETTYLSALPPGKILTDAGRQIAGFLPDGPGQWTAQIPVDLTNAEGISRSEMAYVCRGKRPGDGSGSSDPHYAIGYTLLLNESQISADSEIWMACVFRTANVYVPPYGMIADDEWFSFRAIPEIEGEQTTNDPALLGIDEHIPPAPEPESSPAPEL